MGKGAKCEKGTQRRSLRLSALSQKITLLNKSSREPIPGKFPNDFGKI